MALVPKVVRKDRNVKSPWVVRYEVDGKQREKSFRYRQEAEDFRAKTDNDQRQHIYVQPDMRTSADSYFTSWIESHAVSDGTKRTYRSVYANHVSPAFGGKAIGAVRREDVTRLLLVTMPVTVGAEAVNTARKLLLAMFGEALKGSERPKFTMAARSELESLAKEMGEPWGLTVWLMRGCGLRPSEALGVRYEDFRGDDLRVERQRLRDGSTGPLKGRRQGQYRDVPLPGYVTAMCGNGRGDLFPAGTWDTYQHRFARAVKAAGLDGFHPHMLRHCYASALLAAGVSVFDVSRYLGHRSTDFTTRIYGHLVPSAVSRAREVLDAEMT
jgi:integrase